MRSCKVFGTSLGGVWKPSEGLGKPWGVLEYSLGAFGGSASKCMWTKLSPEVVPNQVARVRPVDSLTGHQEFDSEATSAKGFRM